MRIYDFDYICSSQNYLKIIILALLYQFCYAAIVGCFLEITACFCRPVDIESIGRE